MRSSVSEKGQVTIPKPLRDRLGIRVGQLLDFAEHNGTLIVTKVAPVDPVDSVYGILTRKGSTDELIAELRGEPDNAEPKS